MESFSDDEVSAVRLTYYITNSLSLMGDCYVIFSHLRTKDNVVFPMRLAYFLAIADAIQSFASILPAFFLDTLYQDIEEMESEVCWLQASLGFYFRIAATIWTTSIAFAIYRLVVFMDANTSRYEPVLHILNWGVPMILLLVLIGLGAIGPSEPFCYISDEYAELRFPFIFGVVLSCLLIDIYLYYKVFRGIKSHRQDISEILSIEPETFVTVEIRISKRIIHIIIVFVFCWTWPIINRIHSLISPNPSVRLAFGNQLFINISKDCRLVEKMNDLR
eukprot:TRINITY_DN7198_c0_g1_i1.p1 TRINITY_DN7198_c0_g1~~TRINITY_DN7198_c0_g1_i1.p1  ORF type:complete len:276 (-),score=44.97 TRINITY_DN7198_c0_g1_i1:655-1482(-)